MKKKIKILLRKCKSFSSALDRSSSYTTLRSKSTKSQEPDGGGGGDGEVIVLVGSSRRRSIIQAKYLNHPVIRALIDRSSQSSKDTISVQCEVVLFDHLLWMLENGDFQAIAGGSSEEVAALYAY